MFSEGLAYIVLAPSTLLGWSGKAAASLMVREPAGRPVARVYGKLRGNNDRRLRTLP